MTDEKNLEREREREKRRGEKAVAMVGLEWSREGRGG